MNDNIRFEDLDDKNKHILKVLYGSVGDFCYHMSGFTPTAVIFTQRNRNSSVVLSMPELKINQDFYSIYELFESLSDSMEVTKKKQGINGRLREANIWMS